MAVKSMIKFGCPNCGEVFKVATREQWTCTSCYARLFPGMKKWKVSPTQKVQKVKVKRPRGRPKKIKNGTAS